MKVAWNEQSEVPTAIRPRKQRPERNFSLE